MSKIEWTEKTWNPTTGCNKVSQGCKNCYAETMHKRLQGMGQQKYQQDFLKGVVTHDSELNYPLTIKKPTTFFVNSMSDLFHKDVPGWFIDRVFAVMGLCPQHTFQILTKRADVMYEYFKSTVLSERWDVAAIDILSPTHDWHGELDDVLPNVILGVSAEDQETFNHRSVYLAWLASLGWKTMLSLEPLLGPIQLYMDGLYTNSFHWVITGGESGHRARPMHPDWVRSIRDQCKAAAVPFFFKQWGQWLPLEFDAQAPFRRFAHDGELIDGHQIDVLDSEDPLGTPGRYAGLKFMDAMEAIVFCSEQDADQCDFLNCGNKGKFKPLLDGREHREYPKRKEPHHA